MAKYLYNAAAKVAKFPQIWSHCCCCYFQEFIITSFAIERLQSLILDEKIGLLFVCRICVLRLAIPTG